jgi:polysaccharide export outer membrane protein
MALQSRSFLPIVWLALFSASVLICVDPAGAQTDVGSELQMLQGLTPEQRNALAQQLGVAGAGGALGTPRALGGRDEQAQEELLNFTMQQHRALLMDEQKQREELQRLSPFLEGDDWIVVTIDSRPLPTVAETPTNLPSALANLPPSTLAALTAQLGVNPPGSTAGGYALPSPVPGQVALIDLIRSMNPYQLSHEGVLTLPGFAPIPLSGLTEQLATLRLGVEPALRGLYMRVTKLPLNKTGSSALKPFGYDLFDRQVSTFAPATNVPVPADYVVGPGDELDVQLYGTKNKNLQLIVGRDGRVAFPELGPINVGGQTFRAVKAAVESRVERQLIGAHASVTMGDTRTIRVFVLGDAREPGSYAVSGLATISSALYAAGGIRPIGSLRNIELKRRGELVRRLDLYDMLIRGDTSDDTKLLPGDVIFVPAVGSTVSVDGQVHRPAIYEIRNENSVADVIRLAGGFTPEADTAKLTLTRIDPSLHRVVLQVDLNAAPGKSETVRNGDSLQVSRLRPTLDSGIVLQGYVYTPGAFAYHDGMRLSEVIRSVDDLKPNADLHYVLIRRELPPDRRIVVRSADLDAALRAPGSPADVPLMARDRITVFDLQSSRDRIIQPLLDELRLQSNIGYPEEVVQIDGRANVPGTYPLEVEMRVRDLIRAGGGLSDAAYAASAELTRYKVINGEMRQTELAHVDLAAALRGDPAADMRLEPFDRLTIKEVQAWSDQGAITLRGEVKFPGRYSIKRGETLKSVLLRAGGLTQYAFPEGSVFTRVELRVREQRELDQLTDRMRKDIAFAALQGAAFAQSGAAGAGGAAGGGAANATLSVGRSLLAQLSESRAVGRLVINLPRIMRSPTGAASDVILRDGDQLNVPKFEQEVTVIGEVQSASSHLYRVGLGRDDYIAQSGGETIHADKSRIYVVRADGSVISNEGATWFRHSSGTQIRPGDTVVVPLNAERLPPLALWQAVTQILYNIAIATAAVHAL